MAKKNNIRKYKKPININIGIIIFGMIFLYILAFGIFRYFKSSHISAYEVAKGSLSTNSKYNALIIRNEKLFTANSSGNVNYYAREGSKVSFGEPIYAIDSEGRISAALKSASTDESTLSNDDFNKLSNTITSFQYSFDSKDFGKVYDLKSTLDRNILEMLNLNLLSNSTVDTSGFSVVNADEPGIVVYSYDGYENVTLDSFTKDMLDEKSHTKTALKSGQEIEAGDNVYKLITDEDWNMVIEVSDDIIEQLGDSKSVEIHFVEDDRYAWPTVSVIDKEDSHFLVLNLKNSAIRYATKRFVSIELNINDSTGLKIPVTSLVDKEVYTIPLDYLTYGANSNVPGFNVEVYDKDGNTSSEFKEVNICYSDDEYYYVEKSAFNMGDYLIKPESVDRYQIGPTTTIKGVYNINMGYAVFKAVIILNQNDEYCIVQSGTRYGLAQYDHIVLDSSLVNEDDIVY